MPAAIGASSTSAPTRVAGEPGVEFVGGDGGVDGHRHSRRAPAAPPDQVSRTGELRSEREQHPHRDLESRVEAVAADERRGRCRRESGSTGRPWRGVTLIQTSLPLTRASSTVSPSRRVIVTCGSRSASPAMSGRRLRDSGGGGAGGGGGGCAERRRRGRSQRRAASGERAWRSVRARRCCERRPLQILDRA